MSESVAPFRPGTGTQFRPGWNAIGPGVKVEPEFETP
jgi:hypothetical protein